MAFPKGKPRPPGSGRRPGTPNKKTQDLHDIADSLGVHPFKVLLHFAAGDWKALGYKSETYREDGKDYTNEVMYIQPETRLKAASQAAEYLYPKRKSIEVTELQPTIEDPVNLKSFSEFCECANYPKPFEKQIEMMNFSFQNKDPRMILGSRGYGKTDYITILGVAYDVYVMGPMTTNLIITKSKSRNTAIIEEIAAALTANGVELEKQNASCIRIKGKVGKDYSVEAITIRTSLRGRHPKRTLMDDPVTEEDVSEAMRKLVKRKYNEVFKLCSNVVVIGQPAHKHDLYSELRPIVLKMEVPYGTIPELDHDLEAQRLAGVDESSIQASYYLNIVTEGSSPFDKVKYIDQFPRPGTAVAFIDPSDGGNDTAVSIIKMFGEGVAVVGYTWKKSWHHCIPDLKELFKKFRVEKACFETNKHGQQPIDVLISEFEELGIGITGRYSNNNKHSRIMAAGTFAETIHISKESSRNYIDQVVQYEYGAKTDDAPDSLATGLEWVGLIRGKM